MWMKTRNTPSEPVQRRPRTSDHGCMAYYTIEQWVALSAVCGIGIVGILRVLAFRFEHDRSLHDLRLRAGTLKRDYTARLAALKAGADEEVLEVDVVDDATPMPMQAAA